nr:MAG TPA: hypothetical protein [Caudoviricetes sp.]
MINFLKSPIPYGIILNPFLLYFIKIKRIGYEFKHSSP